MGEGLVKTGPERRPRGWLETDLKLVTDMFVTGQIETNGEWMTPHRLAKLIQETGSLEEPPSTGATANILTRWKEYGFAIINDKPLAFIDYTPEGRELGLDELKQRWKSSRQKVKQTSRAPMPQ